jgi:MSHA biogenesis protein MshI
MFSLKSINAFHLPKWLKPRTRHRSYAVLSRHLNGLAGLLLQDDGDKARVLEFAEIGNISLSAIALNQVAAEAHIKNADLITLLDQDAYQTIMVEAPSVPDEEIKNAIRWKVKDLLSFHIDDAVLDHLQVPGGSGRPPSLFVVAAQIPAVRSLVRPFHEADLRLDTIDIRETAQHNLAMRVAPADYAVALLHFDGENGLLTFSFGESLVLARRFEGRGATGDSLLEKVAMEVQRSVDYFERQYSWFPLAKLYLAPVTDSSALLRLLSEYLPIGAEILDMNRIFDFSNQENFQQIELQNSAFHILGASLRRGGNLPGAAR